MTITIRKGRHYCSGILPRLYYKPTVISYNVIFTDSCSYDLQSPDQLDINKLFGIGYFPSHHLNSARFGWRFDLDRQQIEILGYWYIKGVRGSSSMKFVDLNTPHLYTLSISSDHHLLTIDNDTSLSLPLPSRALGYALHPYFGGNQVAPHTMKFLFS